jgi:predicted ArsR family transcriptional regulator
MSNWLERLKGESQAKLLRFLRRAPQTIAALAEELDLSDNAVRTHIAALERDGLIVQSGTLRDTGGKPARVYSLSREGEELFPKAYALVLGELVQEIASQDGQEKARALLQLVARRLASTSRQGGSMNERVQSAAAALTRLGGEVQVIEEQEGWLLQGNACPLSAVASGHPEVCELARALISEITGLPATECCDRRDRPRCAFRVAPVTSLT